MILEELKNAFAIVERNSGVIDPIVKMGADFDEKLNVLRCRFVFPEENEVWQDFIVSVGLHEDAQCPYFGFMPFTPVWRSRVVNDVERFELEAIQLHQAWDVKRNSSAVYYPGSRKIYVNGRVLTRQNTELQYWTLPDFHMLALKRLGIVCNPDVFSVLGMIEATLTEGQYHDGLFLKDLYVLSIEEIIASKLIYEVAYNRCAFKTYSRMQPNEFNRSISAILNAYRMDSRKFVHKRQLVMPGPMLDKMDDRLAWQVTPQSEKAGTVVQLNIGVVVENGELIRTEEFRPVPEILTNLSYRHISPNRMPPAASAAQQVCELETPVVQKIKYKNDVAETSENRIPVVSFATQSIDVHEDTIWISDRLAKAATAIEKETYKFTDPMDIMVAEGQWVGSEAIVALDAIDGEIKNPIKADTICTKIREKYVENRHGSKPVHYVYVTFERVVPVSLGDKFCFPMSAKATVAGIFPYGSRKAEVRIAGELKKRVSIDVLWPANLKKRAYVPVEELMSFKEMILGDKQEIEIDPDNVSSDVLQVNNICVMEDETGRCLTGRLGIQNIVRLVHTAESKRSVRGDLALDEMGIVQEGCGNIKTSGAIYTLLECGASQSVEWLRKQAKKSGVPFTVRERLACLGLTMDGGDFKFQGFYAKPYGTVLTNALPMLVTAADLTPDFIKDSIWMKDMTAACIKIPRGAFFMYTKQHFKDAVEQEGAKDFFLQQDMYVPTPSNLWTRQFKGPDGHYVLDPITMAANVLILHAKADMKWQQNVEKLFKSLNKYWTAIEDSLSGKDGLLREVVYPRVENSIRGVAGSDPSLQIDEVRVSVGAMRRILESEAGRKIAQRLFYMKSMTNTDVVKAFEEDTILGIVIREPIHCKGNTPVMRIRLAHADSRISVHPGAIGMFAGDFDGDQLAVIVPPRELYPELLQGLGFENLVHEGHLDLSKQLKPYYEQVKDCPTVYEMTELLNFTFDLKRGWTIPVCETTEHETGDEVQTARWSQVYAGLNDLSLALLNKQASEDYRTIKVGTAQMGAIANAFRAIAWNENRKDLMEEAHRFYKKFANMALDAKNGGLSHELQDISKAVYGPKELSKWEGSRLGLFEEYLESKFFKPDGMRKANLTDLIKTELPGYHCISKDVSPISHLKQKDVFIGFISEILS